jgi:salicylate hydroxylase
LTIFGSVTNDAWSRYEHLDKGAKSVQEAKARDPEQSFDESLDARVKSFGGNALAWIYQNDIQDVWDDFVSGKQSNGSAT